MLESFVQRIDKHRIKLHLGWRLQVFIFITAFVILMSRRPDALLNAQFWAEDGKYWYADAYNLGIHSLVLPSSGYFQTISRLLGAVVQFFPLVWAPFIFNLTAIVIQILPVNLIASLRFSQLIPSLHTRLFLGLLYLALPNSYEIHANITNAHWHLAILACMVVLATPSSLFIWQAFDVGVILLSALSGPFAVLLMPIATALWWLRRRKWSFILLLCLSAGAVVQGITILLSQNSNRFQTSLGATPELFAKIFASQVVLGALLGQKGSKLITYFSFGYSTIAILLAALGIAIFLYCLLKGPLELRLFSIFAIGVFGMSVLSPVAGEMNISQWSVLWRPGTGVRYWFIPMLGFVTILTWLLGVKRPRQLRLTAKIALVTMIIGIILDWRYPVFTDLDFKNYSKQFVEAPTGTRVTIPINPRGWSMELIKR
ncbi:hypothetical protein [Aetokthonos hydrillicola]|nr:hypothetical protein [Aetokthonos hydrillicola]MBO3460385.1 hypothetical protein [Aetokthonos hydrillicola CCALA 1050]MBW4584493.1 hypothetical protein [Aetokthonos hydrillicola CCALA 1050]